MDDTANLVIKVDSDGVSTADDRLSKLSKTSGEAESATGGLMEAVKGLVAAYLSIEGAIKFAEKLYETTVEFQTLQAQILTAVGSVDQAKVAFQELRDMAEDMPFSLSEITSAFTTLVNRGLDPSRASMIAYGNVAAGLHVSLDTVTGAIAQAANGQFRGLNQLGIKAEETADGITLNFHGVATKIHKDVGDIQAYVQAMGNTRFSDAMKNQMDTLEGSTSQLGKAWDELFNAISQSGAGNIMQEIFKDATAALKDLTDSIASGQLQGYIQAIIFKFQGFEDAAKNAIEGVKAAFKFLFDDSVVNDASNAIQFTIRAIKELPENVKAVAEFVGAEFGAMWNSFVMDIKFAWEEVTNFFSYLVTSAENVGKKLYDAIRHPIDGTFDYTKAQAEAYDQFSSKAVASWDSVTTASKLNDDALEESIVGIANERDASLKAFNDKIAAADALRKSYDAQKKAREDAEKGSGDQLGGMGTKRPDSHINTQKDVAAFEALKKQLALEEDTISESYALRLQLIKTNTEAGSQLQLDMTKELNEKVTEEYEKAFQDRGDKLLQLQDQYDKALAAGQISKLQGLKEEMVHEEQEIKRSLDRRKQMILDDSTLTEVQKHQKILALETQYNEQAREIEQKRQEQTLNTTADFFQNISTIAAAFGSKGAAIAKAAAIVNATIKTYESATSAYAAMAGIPYVGPALGAVAAAAAIAAGMANVAAIKSQTYSGAFDTGGMIPAGSYGMAGENGPELIRGPATVLSSRATADQAGQASKQNVTVNVINNAPGVEVQQSSRDTSDGKIIEMVVQKTVANIATGVRNNPNHPVSQAFETSYNLRRGAA
jgi:hypothetical protein